MKISKLNLNENEQKVLIGIIENAMDVTGGRFSITDELYLYLPEFTKNQIKGYLSQLEQKNIIKCHSDLNQICVSHDLDIEEFWQFEIK